MVQLPSLSAQKGLLAADIATTRRPPVQAGQRRL